MSITVSKSTMTKGVWETTFSDDHVYTITRTTNACSCGKTECLHRKTLKRHYNIKRLTFSSAQNCSLVEDDSIVEDREGECCICFGKLTSRSKLICCSVCDCLVHHHCFQSWEKYLKKKYKDKAKQKSSCIVCSQDVVVLNQNENIPKKHV